MTEKRRPRDDDHFSWGAGDVMVEGKMVNGKYVKFPKPMTMAEYQKVLAEEEKAKKAKK